MKHISPLPVISLTFTVPHRWLAWASLVPALFTAALLLTAAPSWAEKPEWAGEGKHGHKESKEGKDGKHGGKEGKHGGKRQGQERDHDHERSSRYSRQSDGPRVQIQIGGYFGSPQRVAVQQIYGPPVQAGRCPPGLARKNNGCMPPGQARAYALGQPLPRSVIYYDVPPSLVVQLGVPPSGHRYVRVAADILLIAVGTGMVIDAIEDLGR